MVMRVCFVGDVCLPGIDPLGYRIDPAVRAVLERADLRVANLEGPLTRAKVPVRYQRIVLRAEPVRSEILELFDVYSLANNHVMDYREAGLLDTIALLDRLGRRHFGAGLDRGRSLEPLCLDVRGVPCAFLGFTRWHRAGWRKPGAAPDTGRLLKRVVRALRAQGRFVIVYPHWNYEYVDHPAPASRKLARGLIDAGADLVVGAHPHVLQGMETYRGKHIFYSLGNFVFPDRPDPRAQQSAILTVEVKPDRSCAFELTPVHSNSRGARLATGDERLETLGRIEALSATLADREGFRRAFYEAASRRGTVVGREFATEIRNQGLGYLLSRLHRVQLQDILIRLHRDSTRR